MLLGVLLEVALSQFGKRAGATLGLALGRRILTADDVEHHLGGELAGVGQSDRVGVAEVVPADAIAQAIDDVPALAAGGLHADGEAMLTVVPDNVRRGRGLEAADGELGELGLAHRNPR